MTAVGVELVTVVGTTGVQDATRKTNKINFALCLTRTKDFFMEPLLWESRRAAVLLME